MLAINKIKINSFFLFVSIISRLFANFFVFLLLARFYGPEIFGQFTFAHTLSMTFLLLADFGFDILLITEINTVKELKKKYTIINQILSIKIIFTLISFLLMQAFIYIFYQDQRIIALLEVFSFFMIFTAITNFINALFKSFERMEFESLISILTNTLLIFFSIIAIVLRISIYNIAIGFTISRFLGFILGIKYFKKVLPNYSFELIIQRNAYFNNKMIIYGIHFLFSFLFFQVDTILISYLKGDYFVGIYQSVYKLIILPLIIPEILLNVLLPMLSRLGSGNINKWEFTGNLMYKILFVIAVPITIILFVYADEIINLLYGVNYYKDSILILKIFAFTVFVRFILEPFALMLTTSDRQIIRMYTVISATILNIVMNVLVIHNFGIIGVAIISLLSNIFVGFCFMMFNRKFILSWMLNKNAFYILLFSILIITYWEKINLLSSGLGVIVLIPFYFLLALKFYFTVEEKSLLNISNIKFLN